MPEQIWEFRFIKAKKAFHTAERLKSTNILTFRLFNLPIKKFICFTVEATICYGMPNLKNSSNGIAKNEKKKKKQKEI